MPPQRPHHRLTIEELAMALGMPECRGVLFYRYTAIFFFLRTGTERDVAPWCDGSSDRSFMVDPLSYFSFLPELHDWCNKGRGMSYPVCGMINIKEPLLLIGKSSPCGGSGFLLLLSEWTITICPTPYNRK